MTAKPPEPIPDTDRRSHAAVDLFEIQLTLDAIDGFREVTAQFAEATGEDWAVAVAGALKLPVYQWAEALDNLRHHVGIPLPLRKKEDP